MLGPMPWWGFVDWADAFGNGVPAGATDGHSAVITLQYVYTLQQAADLFGYFGGQYSYAAQRARKLVRMISELVRQFPNPLFGLFRNMLPSWGVVKNQGDCGWRKSAGLREFSYGHHDGTVGRARHLSATSSVECKETESETRMIPSRYTAIGSK